jgi:hypothetical protein
VFGALLGTPYLIVGVIWSSTHTAHLHDLNGGTPCISGIIAWPAPA